MEILVSIVIGVISPAVAVWLFRKGTATDNARHLEDIKRQDVLRKADEERERIQREADYAKQKELFDNERKLRKAEGAELKKTLIMNILIEIRAIQEFLITNPICHVGCGYALEVGAITQTIPQQVKHFQNKELISKLTDYRTFTNKLITACRTLNELGGGHQPFPGDNPSYTNIRGNWNSLTNEGKRLNAEVWALLLPEYDGELPKELKVLRVG